MDIFEADHNMTDRVEHAWKLNFNHYYAYY